MTSRAMRIEPASDLSEVSPSAFHDNFESKDACYAAALEDGLARLAEVVEVAAAAEGSWVSQLSAGLRAGLDFLAAEPSIANLLLVESLLPSRPAWRERERMLALLAEAVRPPLGHPGRAAMPEETTRLLAGGLASYLSGRVLAGEAERLPLCFDALLVYLLAPSLPAPAATVDEQFA
jgi:AcrR family transcriptional regulator